MWSGRFLIFSFQVGDLIGLASKCNYMNANKQVKTHCREIMWYEPGNNQFSLYWKQLDVLHTVVGMIIDNDICIIIKTKGEVGITMIHRLILSLTYFFASMLCKG